MLLEPQFKKLLYICSVAESDEKLGGFKTRRTTYYSKGNKYEIQNPCESESFVFKTLSKATF